MGLFRVRIHFPHGAPAPALVAEALERRTGLGIASAEADGSVLLSNERFEEPCDLGFQSHDVFLYCSPRVSYLEWCAIACLMDLGGEYGGKIPKFVDTKWSELKWWKRLWT